MCTPVFNFSWNGFFCSFVNYRNKVNMVDNTYNGDIWLRLTKTPQTAIHIDREKGEEREIFLNINYHFWLLFLFCIKMHTRGLIILLVLENLFLWIKINHYLQGDNYSTWVRLTMELTHYLISIIISILVHSELLRFRWNQCWFYEGHLRSLKNYVLFRN